VSRSGYEPSVARVREACLALPGAFEQEAWGDPTWRVAKRIFVMQKGDHEGGRPSLWLKVPPGDQPALVAADPERYFVPPYVGTKGWIGVYLDEPELDWPAVVTLIEQSYRLIAPARLARSLA
jgi:predicted DNA-binding protein (MmcQ/YjbR family)